MRGAAYLSGIGMELSSDHNDLDTPGSILVVDVGFESFFLRTLLK